jgi:hypothetical protein
MEKLDAARNNMSHGLCMFGPDNRRLRWNKRYASRWTISAPPIRRCPTCRTFHSTRSRFDQTFICRIGDSFQAAAIIRSILELGRSRALPVIAEGGAR